LDTELSDPVTSMLVCY